jgi:hypothetical protein
MIPRSQNKNEWTPKSKESLDESLRKHKILFVFNQWQFVGDYFPKNTRPPFVGELSRFDDAKMAVTADEYCLVVINYHAYDFSSDLSHDDVLNLGRDIVNIYDVPVLFSFGGSKEMIDEYGEEKIKEMGAHIESSRTLIHPSSDPTPIYRRLMKT